MAPFRTCTFTWEGARIGAVVVVTPTVVEVVDDRPGKDQAYLLDSAKARSLGWQPRRSFEEGVAETIRWMRDDLDAILREPADYVHKA